MAIPGPSKAGSPFSPLQTGGWNPETPEINNFFIPEITIRGGYNGPLRVGRKCIRPIGGLYSPPVQTRLVGWTRGGGWCPQKTDQ